MSRRTGAGIWTVIDQGLSSISNFGATLLGAHLLAPTEFGSLSLAFSAYVFVKGISYAVAAEPFQIGFSYSHPGRRLRRGERAAIGSALAVGLVSILISLAAYCALPPYIGLPLVVVGLAMPGLLVQDCLRALFFSRGQASSAALLDGVWAVASAALAGLLVPLHYGHSPSVVLGLWAAGAWVAAVVGCVQVGIWPDPTRASAWVSGQFRLILSLCADFVAMSGAALVIVYLLPVFSNVAAVGGLRAAQVLFGPLAIVFQGSRIFGIPYGARVRRERPTALWSASVALTMGFGSLTVAYSAAICLMPGSLGHSLLGPSWDVASPLRIWVALSCLGSALALGAFQGLRVLGDGKRILLARSIDAPGTVALGCAGGALWGVQGAAGGIGVATLLVAGAWITQFRLACRDIGRVVDHEAE